VALAGRITKVALGRRANRLVIRLNAPGVLSVGGRTLRIKHAGTVTVPIRLTKAQRRRLARRHALMLHVVVRFVPAAGTPDSRAIIVVFSPSRAALARVSRH
jgi:hypothetical protein